MGTILELSDIKKVFKNKGRIVHALNGVTFTIKNKQIVGIVGQNGSGKTTILKILSGLLLPDSGSIKLLDLPWDEQMAKKNISVLLEGSRSFYWNLTGRQNLRYFATMSGINDVKRRIEELIELLDLSKFVNSLVGTYSRGMQQRLSLAIALLTRPKILLLDEPTNGLDYEWTQMLANLLLEMKEKIHMSVIVVSHDFGFLYQFVERMLFIQDGTIFRDLHVHRKTSNIKQEIFFKFIGDIPKEIHLPENVYYQFEKDGFYVYGAQTNSLLFQFISYLLNDGYVIESVVTAQNNEEDGGEIVHAESYMG